MSARTLLARSARRAPTPLRTPARMLSTTAPPPPSSEPAPLSPSSPRAQYHASPSKPPPQEHAPNWLSRYLLGHPDALQKFLKVTGALGLHTPKQRAQRRALAIYDRCCAPRAEQEFDFWRHECDLPPTFQSWFAVTNLHIWLLTARLRALPRPMGQDHIQGLIDHFFLDVEDRIRLVLARAPKDGAAAPDGTPLVQADGEAPGQGPTPPAPGTLIQPFYTPRNAAYTYSREGAPMPLRPAPERLVSQQLRVFKEQWAGMGMSLDLALVRGDAELAGALWRNFLGGRGARGIVLPGDPGADDPKVWFRRSVNLVGGDAKAVRKVETMSGGLEAAEREDDNSGVHDYPPAEADKYVKYPELLLTLSTYVRRELARLEKLSDAEIVGPQPDEGVVLRPGREKEGLEKLDFGSVRG